MPRPRMHRVGDDVGGKQVEFIGFNPRKNTPSVWLSSGGDAVPGDVVQDAAGCLLRRLRPRPPPPAAAEAEGGPSPVPADIASKIQKVSDTEFNIDRSVVDKILENQARADEIGAHRARDEGRQGARHSAVRHSPRHAARHARAAERRPSRGHQRLQHGRAQRRRSRLTRGSAPPTASHVNVNRRGDPVTIDFHIK